LSHSTLPLELKLKLLTSSPSKDIYNLSVPERFSSSPELTSICSNPERNSLLLVHIVLSQLLINIANRSFKWMIG
ncbi:hypothetical protein HID58_075749, partial [Brassica napus]